MSIFTITIYYNKCVLLGKLTPDLVPRTNCTTRTMGKVHPKPAADLSAVAQSLVRLSSEEKEQLAREIQADPDTANVWGDFCQLLGYEKPENEGMFQGAAAFNQPIGAWNVSKWTNMNYMFKGAKAFKQEKPKFK